MKRQNEKGSMVVEASLIMPVFIAFIILLITMIRISMVEIALDHAVSEATKQVATHIYPVGIMVEKWNETETATTVHEGLEKIGNIRNQAIEIEEVIKQYEGLLPEEIIMLASIREQFEGKVINQYDQAVSAVFQPIVDHYVDDRMISLERFHVTKVILPNFNSDSPFFGIEARYDMPLAIPFFERTFTFKKQAYERIWYGTTYIHHPDSENGTDSNTDNGDEEDSANKEGDQDQDELDDKDEETLYIDHISSPVQRGHKVHIIVRGPPNQSANVKLFYQSGFKKDKNCRFNSEGWMFCDIIIGGHSNEGKYEAVVTSGDLRDVGYFQVLSKENMNKYIEGRKKARDYTIRSNWKDGSQPFSFNTIVGNGYIYRY